MKLRRKAYTVGLNTEDGHTEQVVEVTPADMLRAETEGRRYGLPANIQDAPLGYTTLWCYVAMVRTGAYAGKWQQFVQVDLYDFEPVKAEDGEQAGTTVDPTTEAPSASASPSPSTTATPATG